MTARSRPTEGKNEEGRKARTAPQAAHHDPNGKHKPHRKVTLRTANEDYENGAGIQAKSVPQTPGRKHHTKPRKSLVSNSKDDLVKKNGNLKPLGAAKRKNNRPKLEAGTIINSETHTYQVIEVLGSGGFGDVYKVEQASTKGTFAMKTEQTTGSKSAMANERLKIETAILAACNKVTDPERRRHFIKMEDKGCTEKFKFIVMEMVGPSIDDIRRHVICTDFTKSSATKLSIQTLQGIADLHALGFLHRDIKPQNFCVGLHGDEGVVYIIDFGIARQYMNRNGKDIRVAREHVRFLGTIRYASRSCHLAKEQSRKDDVESWIFMSVELFDSQNIPWKKNIDRTAVLIEKERFFSLHFPHIWQRVPTTYKQIIKMVDGYTYESEPDYQGIQKLIETGAKDAKIDLDQLLDWAGRIKSGIKKRTPTVIEKIAEKSPPEEEHPVAENGIADTKRMVDVSKEDEKQSKEIQ